MRRWRRVGDCDFDVGAVVAVELIEDGYGSYGLRITFEGGGCVWCKAATSKCRPHDTPETMSLLQQQAKVEAEAVRAAFVRSLPGGEDDMDRMREAVQKPGWAIQVDTEGHGGWIGEAADRLNELLSGADTDDSASLIRRFSDEKARNLGELWLLEEACGIISRPGSFCAMDEVEKSFIGEIARNWGKTHGDE